MISRGIIGVNMSERSNYLPPGLYAGGGYGRPPRAISLTSPGITNFERYPRAVHVAIGCVVRASRFNNGEGDKSRWELAAAWRVFGVMLHLVTQQHPTLQDLEAIPKPCAFRHSSKPKAHPKSKHCL